MGRYIRKGEMGRDRREGRWGETRGRGDGFPNVECPLFVNCQQE